VKNVTQILRTFTYAFWVFFGYFFVQPVVAQNTSTNKIGDFAFKVSDQMGWRASAEAISQAESILKHEGVKLAPSFAFSNGSGSLVFGTIKILRDGLAFTAQQLASNVPQFPETWGVKNNEVQNASGRTDYGLEFAVMRVSGPGDGKVFGRGKSYKTVGVWIDIPVQYQDINGYHSVLISLFYRGFDSKKSSDENFLKLVMNSISPTTGTSIITDKMYKAQFESPQVEGGEINKTEPKKVDSTQSVKNTIPAGGYLLDVIKYINAAAIIKPTQSSSTQGNISECENLKLINEQDANLIALMKVVEANYLSYQRCALMLKIRLSDKGGFKFEAQRALKIDGTPLKVF
jgi:hypothetical protein